MVGGGRKGAPSDGTESTGRDIGRLHRAHCRAHRVARGGKRGRGRLFARHGRAKRIWIYLKSPKIRNDFGRFENIVKNLSNTPAILLTSPKQTNIIYGKSCEFFNNQSKIRGSTPPKAAGMTKSLSRDANATHRQSKPRLRDKTAGRAERMSPPSAQSTAAPKRWAAANKGDR